MDEKLELRLADVREVFRIVQHVCEAWDDPAVWRRRLCDSANQLVSGYAAVLSWTGLTANGTFLPTRALEIVGFPQPVRDGIVAANVKNVGDQTLEQIEAACPGYGPFFQRAMKDGHATNRRAELVDDERYYASWFAALRKPANADDYIISVRTVDVPARFEVLVIDRSPGAARFGGREVALLKLLHDEIAPLVGVRLATEAHFSRDGLSARLRETLDLLLEGLGEKEIAARMHLSQHTVHDYVGVLYKHFQVNTRPELMAYFLKRLPGSRLDG